MPQVIAIIEDDQAIAKMYKTKFENEGFVVHSASNGLLGLKLVQDVRPDIVLLDLMMPQMNGDEMLEKMRSTGWGKDITVVVLTNVGEAEIDPKIRELNISGLIIKAQVTPSQMIAKVRQILSKN